MIDGRLLVPAVGTWLGAAACQAWLTTHDSMVERHALAIRIAFGAAAAALLLVLVVLAVTVLVATRTEHRPRDVAIAAGAVALGVLAVALWVVRTAPPPVAEWLDARATAQVVGVVTGEPETRVAGAGRMWGESAWLQVAIRAERISARGQTVQVRVPLIVRLAVGTAVPSSGSRVSVSGRLAAVPGSSGAVGTIRATGGLRMIEASGPVDALAHRMRVGLRVALQGTPPEAGALVAGLAIGDESLQPPALSDAMRASGLAHLTAVSGGNVAIVLAAAVAVGAILRLRLWARVAIGAATLGFFVVLVGGQPSVLRAAVMGVAALIAILAGGRRAGPSVLGTAVVALVVIQPWLAVSWGFALSVVATAGLVLLAGPVRDRLSRWPLAQRWPLALVDAASLTVAAQVATLPVLVAMGAAVGWVSVPANLIAMPAVAPVTVLGLAAAALSVVAPVPAGWIAHTAAWPAGWIAHVATAAEGMPGARMPWPSGWTGLILLAMVSAAGVVAHRMWTTRLGVDVPHSLTRAIVGALLVAAVIVILAPPSRRGWPPPGWFMIMCDVGQGDGIVLRSGPARAVVVDAGPDPEIMDGCLADAGIDAVDAVVLTHFHADHVRGLAGVLHGRRVAAVLATPVREPAEEAEGVDGLLADEGLAAVPITAGDVRRAGDVQWRALWPRRRISAGSVPNNASVVLLATVRGRTIWLGGDVEPEAQSAMAPELPGSPVDVVKVPHHGSANQWPELPTRLPGAVALISVGAGNEYGHPAPETVAAWAATGALVARTDEDGDIAVVETASGIGVVTRHDMLPSP